MFTVSSLYRAKGLNFGLNHDPTQTHIGFNPKQKSNCERKHRTSSRVGGQEAICIMYIHQFQQSQKGGNADKGIMALVYVISENVILLCLKA